MGGWAIRIMGDNVSESFLMRDPMWVKVDSVHDPKSTFIFLKESESVTENPLKRPLEVARFSRSISDGTHRLTQSVLQHAKRRPSQVVSRPSRSYLGLRRANCSSMPSVRSKKNLKRCR
ncbi:hypothetical protein CDAR_222381 [Caerostris darwini]|uniref:Uncharacterized protein n=1 Tax=Caerostris darwini TaxID=1538125 RepID=A0AAV4STX8_9ARAC|nr:hypothetical protein CDAR_222381 [Caerostris darwini]